MFKRFIENNCIDHWFFAPVHGWQQTDPSPHSVEFAVSAHWHKMGLNCFGGYSISHDRYREPAAATAVAVNSTVGHRGQNTNRAIGARLLNSG